MKATFAAGCFWGIEANFRKLKIKDAKVGYMGGDTDNPSYDDVCSDKTGHAEVCQVEFDPKEISYEELLEAFWNMHDPTQINRQGPDHGTQYRSSIFYHDEAQKKLAEKSKVEQQKKLDKPIATEIVPSQTFWKAEEYHQRYLEKKGGFCH